jgi:hypothetical protein
LRIFNNLSESKKLSYILNPSTPSQVNKLGSFIKKTVIRTEDSGLLTYLLENADFMCSLLHVYCVEFYCKGEKKMNLEMFANKQL